MTAPQLDVFTAAEPPANRTPTSIAAARKVKESGKAERDRRVIYNLIKGGGPIGLTMKEIEQYTLTPRHILCARCAELRAEDRRSRELKLAPKIRWLDDRNRRDGCMIMVAV